MGICLADRGGKGGTEKILTYTHTHTHTHTHTDTKRERERERKRERERETQEKRQNGRENKKNGQSRDKLFQKVYPFNNLPSSLGTTLNYDFICAKQYPYFINTCILHILYVPVISISNIYLYIANILYLSMCVCMCVCVSVCV